MSNIVLKENEVAGRGRKINKLLMPLLKNPQRQPVTWQLIKESDLSIKIVARDNHFYNNSDWGFSTFHENFKALYFEIWKPRSTVKPDVWVLVKSYLQIYRVDKVEKTSEEYISLHSDSSDHTSLNSKYKRSPHLHIMVAEAPIPKAHIALANILIERTSSEKDFFEIMRSSIEMLKLEILDKV